VTGRGYEVQGDIIGPGGAGTGRLLRDLTLCNEARIFRDGPTEWRLVGDPMEAALLVAAAKGGVEQPALRDGWTRVDETPFDSESQCMTTLDRHMGGGLLEVVKGSPEVVLRLVAESAEATEAHRVALELANEGFRVLAVADRACDGERAGSGGSASHELVGLVGIADPLRAEAVDVIRACHDAGIKTILITGDHPPPLARSPPRWASRSTGRRSSSETPWPGGSTSSRSSRSLCTHGPNRSRRSTSSTRGRHAGTSWR